MNVSNLLANLGSFKAFSGILLAIVILLAMITIHEFGHYIAGKILGFKINEFSIGFGPALFKKRSKRTGELFALRIIPLGGYCAFDGEDQWEEDEKKAENKEDEEPFEEYKTQGDVPETNVVDKETEGKDEYPQPKGARFNDRAPWRRIIVLVAGALMNYLLALTLIVIMFASFGRPVYAVVKEMPTEGASPEAWDVYNSGLQTGDVILEINGKDLYLITDYMSALDGKKQGDTVGVLVIRDGKKQVVDVTIANDCNPKSMSDTNSIYYALDLVYPEGAVDENGDRLRISLVSCDTKDGFFDAIGHSFVYSFKIGGTILRSLGELLTGKLGINAVGGPATTIKVTSKVASNGFQDFLFIAAFIGVNLAVFNLLPVPALDGCRVIFCIIEWIRKKPINRKVETIINFAGLIFLFGFAILVDILQFVP